MHESELHRIQIPTNQGSSVALSEYCNIQLLLAHLLIHLAFERILKTNMVTKLEVLKIIITFYTFNTFRVYN